MVEEGIYVLDRVPIEEWANEFMYVARLIA
jgi:hypothetical protein